MMISFAFTLYFFILCFQYEIYKYIHHLTSTTPEDIIIREFKQIWQMANVRFKLRISQNRKWTDKNSLKQFLQVKNCVKLLIYVLK